MGARVPTRLSGPTQITNSAVTQITGGSGVTTVLRHIHCQNPSGSPVNSTLSIGSDAANKRLYDAYPIAAGAVLDAFVYYVLAPTEIVQAFGSTTAVLVLTIDGDVITLGA